MDPWGRCHLCRQMKPIRWCGVCEHYFCESCRSRYWQRGIAAVREMIGGRYAGCCGPVRNHG